MRPILTGSAVTAAFLLVSLAACKKEDPPPQNPQGWQQGQPGYQQQPAPYGQPQPGQPAPTMAPAPGPAPAPTPGAPPAAGTAGMNPNPQGVPCTSDAQCLTHKCNVTAQKCSWPCQGPGDCAPGMQCLAPICVPSVPGAAPPPAK
jgi:hypothetical protein